MSRNFWHAADGTPSIYGKNPLTAYCQENTFAQFVDAVCVSGTLNDRHVWPQSTYVREVSHVVRFENLQTDLDFLEEIGVLRRSVYTEVAAKSTNANANADSGSSSTGTSSSGGGGGGDGNSKDPRNIDAHSVAAMLAANKAASRNQSNREAEGTTSNSSSSAGGNDVQDEEPAAKKVKQEQEKGKPTKKSTWRQYVRFSISITAVWLTVL